MPEKTVSNMDVLIGNKKVFQSSTGSFIDNPVEQDTVIKDFRLADTIGSSIPTSDHTRVSADRVLTANSSAVPSNSDVNVVGSGISGINFSPVAGQNKNWFTISKENPSVAINTNIVTHNNKIGANYDIIVNTYDSDLTLFDSGNDYKTVITLQNVDDSNQPIKWTYEVLQPEKRINIGYDSTETSYLIKKYKNEYNPDDYDAGGTQIASLLFYPQKTDLSDSSEPIFFNSVGTQEKGPISSINVICDKFGLNLDNENLFNVNIVTFSELDSTQSESSYVFENELPEIQIYDSIGALP